MDVDSIVVPARRSSLSVVMLVNPRVQPADVQDAMPGPVEKVKHDIIQDESEDSVLYRELRELPCDNGGVVPAEVNNVIDKDSGHQFVPEDKADVLGVAFIQGSSSGRDAAARERGDETSIMLAMKELNDT
jgi:hypothetical protein